MQKNKIFVLILFVVVVGCAIWVQPTIAHKDNTSESVKTKYTLKTRDGEYPVYITNSGSCFINRPKANSTYRDYLEPETSKTICKELNIEYKPEKRQKEI